MKSIAAEPAVQQRFVEAGARVISSSPAELAAYAQRERAMWKEAVHLSGARMD